MTEKTNAVHMETYKKELKPKINFFWPVHDNVVKTWNQISMEKFSFTLKLAAKLQYNN